MTSGLNNKQLINSKMSQVLTGNDKRKASCKAVGGEKKKTGHKREDHFAERWGDVSSAITYKAEADKTITDETLLKKLNETLGPLTSGRTSLKSGNNLQFTLGVIPEITEADDKVAAIAKQSLWEKYLAKSHSANPADILCYRSKTDWIFFKMSDVISFIVKNAKWRALSSGRLKGDFVNKTSKGFSQYLTYEYRQTHKSHFLGANGNKGQPFIDLLKENLKFHVEAD